MLLSADNMLAALASNLQALGAANDGGHQGSLQQTLGISLKLLQQREVQGSAHVWQQCQCLAQLLDTLQDQPLAHLSQSLRTLIPSTELRTLEQQWRRALGDVEAWLNSHPAQALSSVQKQVLAKQLCAFETQDLRAQLGDVSQSALDDDQPVNHALLQHYLQERFNDKDLCVTELRPLSGGFGKQTYLFSTQGQALTGEFVLRRDPKTTLLNNDCHLIDREHQVLTALKDEGFPAPEVLWLDTEHALLPGGHFLVMRRTQGEPGGSVFGAQGKVGSELSQTLARITAQLHTLPVPSALANTCESINKTRLAMSRRDVVNAYISDWIELFYGDVHIPSPTLSAQLNWLRSNIPDIEGLPVLLHGDIGFHNFLLEQGTLTAVLDWEFAHLGDPAEELAYIRNTLGASLDWPEFMAQYQQAGGEVIDERRLLFFQIWGQLRNALSANVAVARFDNGQIPDAKMIVLAHTYLPMFLDSAQQLIEQYGALQ